jgi:hypothetical protein
MEADNIHPLDVERMCLVCEWRGRLQESSDTPDIGMPCPECHAPTERTRIVRVMQRSQNPNAVALGRLGGLRGGPARAAALTPRRRREIARAAARARWSR